MNTTTRTRIAGRLGRVDRARPVKPRVAGAALALATSSVALSAIGFGGIGIGQAAGQDETPIFVPVAPCRLADTRPGDDHIGTADTLQPDAAVTFDVRGSNGNCDLPAAATAVSFNLTAVNQTALTFLTAYPTGTDRPKASHLNPAPGQPPTPNAVTVDLDDDGRFDLYNKQGTVDVIVDVIGYYADHHHDDRYASIAHSHDGAGTLPDLDGLYAPLGHDHDDRYFTEAEVDQRISSSLYTHSVQPVTLNLSPWGLTGRNTSNGNVHPNAPFVPYDYKDTGCVRNSTGSQALMLPVDLPVGAIVTNVAATTIDAGTGSAAYFAILYSDTPTAAPQTVAELNFGNGTTADAAIATSALPVLANRTVEQNEHFYLQFNPGPEVAALCRVSITYRMPG